MREMGREEKEDERDGGGRRLGREDERDMGGDEIGEGDGEGLKGRGDGFFCFFFTMMYLLSSAFVLSVLIMATQQQDPNCPYSDGYFEDASDLRFFFHCGGGVGMPNNDCTSFLSCVGWIPYVMQCPDTTFWNDRDGSCGAYVNSTCFNGY
ncbi:hypothetical protein LOTGIDRAFT_233398 [Lottia gigantea]|uniref:Chitin-binding type-2 domain-containing protein n=1 Tax=Lottia gigantea TaxID=225164 RepID=V4A969_LOTGI|nr:hypothetical protein LOTGIDRAFT_233398 [Lottia gigantea]ESO91615.1 hypothetical protein LOTGIDRAFT_233398 [Lottia gigantea]